MQDYEWQSTARYGLVEPAHEVSITGLLKLCSQGNVVNLGCSINLHHISSMVKFADRLIGVDSSYQVLKHYAGRTIEQFSYYHANGIQMPFASNSIDLLLMLGVYGVQPTSIDVRSDEATKVKHQQHLLLKESARVIKSNLGFVVLSNSKIRDPLEITIERAEERFGRVISVDGINRYLLICSDPFRK